MKLAQAALNVGEAMLWMVLGLVGLVVLGTVIYLVMALVEVIRQ